MLKTRLSCEFAYFSDQRVGAMAQCLPNTLLGVHVAGWAFPFITTPPKRKCSSYYTRQLHDICFHIVIRGYSSPCALGVCLNLALGRWHTPWEIDSSVEWCLLYRFEGIIGLFTCSNLKYFRQSALWTWHCFHLPRELSRRHCLGPVLILVRLSHLCGGLDDIIGSLNIKAFKMPSQCSMN